MITTFENTTENISEKEKQFIPYLLTELQSKLYPRKAHEICRAINRMEDLPVSMEMNPLRLRRITHYLRANGIAAIIANEKGYFLAQNSMDIKLQIISLKDRVTAMQNVIRGLEIMLNETNQNSEGNI
jgi:hypothetical protein